MRMHPRELPPQAPLSEVEVSPFKIPHFLFQMTPAGPVKEQSEALMITFINIFSDWLEAEYEKRFTSADVSFLLLVG